jgi:hypothetical protein
VIALVDALVAGEPLARNVKAEESQREGLSAREMEEIGPAVHDRGDYSSHRLFRLGVRDCKPRDGFLAGIAVLDPSDSALATNSRMRFLQEL